MPIYLLEDPVCEPVTISEVKKHLKIDESNTSEDMAIEEMIRSARADAENRTQRIFASSKWVWYPEGVNFEEGEYIPLPITPVHSASVSTVADDSLVEENKYRFIKSSLNPKGSPLYGFLKVLEDFDEVDYAVTMEAGWPNITKTQPKPYVGFPSLLVNSTSYPNHTTIELVFDRDIEGLAYPDTFKLYVNEAVRNIKNVDLVDGKVNLSLFSGEPLTSGDSVSLSYIAGFLCDKEGNYVQPIMDVYLPDVDTSLPSSPIPEREMEEVYVSTVPAPVKQWILVRVGTLYQQRTEIALRSGQANNALFPRDFINGVLDAYTIEML